MRMQRQTISAFVLTGMLALAILVGALVPPEIGESTGLPYDGAPIHILAFAFLVLPLVLMWPRRTGTIVVVSILFGAAIELIQGFVGRSPEISDIAADFVGILLGAGVGLLFARGLARRRERPRRGDVTEREAQN